MCVCLHSPEREVGYIRVMFLHGSKCIFGDIESIESSLEQIDINRLHPAFAQCQAAVVVSQVSSERPASGHLGTWAPGHLGGTPNLDQTRWKPGDFIGIMENQKNGANWMIWMEYCHIVMYIYIDIYCHVTICCNTHQDQKLQHFMVLRNLKKLIQKALKVEMSWYMPRHAEERSCEDCQAENTLSGTHRCNARHDARVECLHNLSFFLAPFRGVKMTIGRVDRYWMMLGWALTCASVYHSVSTQTTHVAQVM